MWRDATATHENPWKSAAATGFVRQWVPTRVCHFLWFVSLGRQGKRVYAMGPDRVYILEASEGLHSGGVYFYLP